MVGIFVFRFVVGAWVCVLVPESGVAAEQKLHLMGSGASFPAPLYTEWFKQFSHSHRNVLIAYQAKGSGAGIQDLVDRTVDFAASDAEMKPEDIAKVPGGVQLLPMTAGEIVVAYNLPGMTAELKLPRSVYPALFLGQIRRWNDPRIVRANPTLTLPDLPITVVRRADSSGTTFVFTSHLSAVSPQWKAGPGAGNTVEWPHSEQFLAAPKNDGVIEVVKRTPGAIGYVDYVQARGAGVAVASLQNKAGAYIKPGIAGGEATLADARFADDLIAWVLDPEGSDDYPIATFSWMIFYKDNGDADKARVLREMVEFGLTEGQKRSAEMGYLPLPETVVQRVRSAAGNIR